MGKICMKKRQGFSLIELLTTLAIISILTTLSIPLYTHYTTQESRIEAEVALENLASALEDYATLNNTYENATLAQLNIPNDTANHRYQLSIATADASHYLIQATPLNNNDPLCGTLTLNDLSEKGITGAGQLSDCW